MQTSFINPRELCPTFGWTHVATVTGGRTVYGSGQVGVNEQGEVVGRGEIASTHAAGV